jgi:tetratricopeptide (TPR) repeat protein
LNVWQPETSPHDDNAVLDVLAQDRQRRDRVMANGPELQPAKIDGKSRLEQEVALARLAMDRSRPDEAERIAAGILKHAPRHWGASYILGCALLKQGRSDEAVPHLESAAHGRHDPEVETMLGVGLRHAGRLTEALARLRRAAKRRPPYATAYYELGALCVAMDNYDEAIDVFRSGLEIAPMMPELSIELGYALLWRKRYAEALAAFAHALEITPRSAQALFGIGKAHRDSGEVAPAADYFRRALVIKPADPTIWLALGLALQELGQADAARDALCRAARGDRKLYDRALNSLVVSARGRFWLRPSAAAQFFEVEV